MDRPQNGALTPERQQACYVPQSAGWNDFILFAVAIQLDALEERQGTATIEAHQVAVGCKTKNTDIYFQLVTSTETGNQGGQKNEW